MAIDTSMGPVYTPPQLYDIGKYAALDAIYFTGGGCAFIYERGVKD